MENNSNDIHKQNQKKIEYYINRLQNINDNIDDIKVVIEDSFENQEKEYEENNRETTKIREVSLTPLFIVIILGINLMVYNKYGDDNILILFITICISLYIYHKLFPKKAKKKLARHFQDLLDKITNLFLFLFKDDNKTNESKKYISVSSEDKNKLLKEEEKTDNNMESPLLNI